MGIPPKNNQESKNKIGEGNQKPKNLSGSDVKKGDTSEGFFSNFMGNIKKSFSDKKSSVSGLFSGSMSKLFNKNLNFKKNISSDKNDKDNKPKTVINFLNDLFHLFQISDYFEKNYQKKTKKMKKILEAISKDILPIIGDIQSKLEDYSSLKIENFDVTSFLRIILESFKEDGDIPKLKDILKASIIFKTIRIILGHDIKMMLNVFEDIIQRFKDISDKASLFFDEEKSDPFLKITNELLPSIEWSIDGFIFLGKKLNDKKLSQIFFGADRILNLLKILFEKITKFTNETENSNISENIEIFSGCFLSFINKLANSSKNGLLLIVGMRGFDAVDKSCDKIILIFEKINEFLKNINIKKISENIEIFSGCFLSFINKLANSSKNGLLLIVGMRGFDAVDKSCDKIIPIFEKINEFLKNIDIKKISDSFLKITNELLPSIKSSIDEFIFLGKKLNDKKLSQIFFGADRILNLLKILFEKITKFTNETENSNISKNIEIFSDCFLSFINNLANSSKNGLLLIVGMRGFDAVDKSCDKIILIFEKINGFLKNIDIKKISDSFLKITNELLPSIKSSIDEFIFLGKKLNDKKLSQIFFGADRILNLLKILFEKITKFTNETKNSKISKNIEIFSDCFLSFINNLANSSKNGLLLIVGMRGFNAVDKSCDKIILIFEKINGFLKNIDIKKISNNLKSFSGFFLEFTNNLYKSSFKGLLINYLGLLNIFVSIFLITKIIKIVLLNNPNINKSNITFSKLAKISKSLGIIAISLAVASWVSLLINPIGLLLLFSVLTITLGIFNLLSIIAGKNIKESCKDLLFISLTLFLFSVSIAFSVAIMSKVPIMFLLMFIGVILVITGILYLLSKLQKDVARGALSMIIISIAMLIMSYALMVFYKATKDMTVEQAIIGMSIIALYTLGTIWIAKSLQKKSMSRKNLEFATETMISTSISLLIASIGLLIFYEATKNMKIEKALIGAAVIGIFVGGVIGISFLLKKGVVSMKDMETANSVLMMVSISLLISSIGLLVFYHATKNLELKSAAIGVGIVLAFFGMMVAIAALTALVSWAGVVAAGAALVLMSTSILIAANGIKVLAEIKWPDEESNKRMVSFGVAMLGFMMSLAPLGPVSIFLIPASLALYTVGHSLVSFSKNLNESMNILNWSTAVKKLKDISNVITGITAAFASVAFSGGIGGVLTGIFKTLTLGLGKNSAEQGADAVKASGKALIEITDGIIHFSNLTKNLNFDINDKNSITNRICTVLTAVSSVFASIGMTAIPKGIWGLISGNDVNFVERGINSCKNMGNVLNSLADGISAWMELPEGMNIETISKNIKTVLDTVSKSFSSIGMTAIPKGIWGLISGNDVNFVEKGINSCKNMGNVLNSLADGISAWMELPEGMNIETISKNIKTVLDTVSKSFSSIGMTAIPKGIWGLISGNDVNFVEKGINSCKNMGNVLNSLADGISAWMELPEGMDVQKISWNIKHVLNIISGAFTSIGMTAIPKGIWGFISGDDVNFVERGINSCKNMGNVLNSLAKGIMTWMELPEGMDVQKISWNIRHVLNIISGAFASIGSNSAPAGIWGLISGDNVNFVENGIKSCKNMGSILKSLADAILKWQKLSEIGITEDDFDEKKPGITQNIKRFITIFSNIFAEIGKEVKEFSLSEGQTSFMKGEDVMKGVKSCKGMGGIVKDIGYAIEVFAKKVPKGPEVANLKDEIKGYILTISDVFAEIGKGEFDTKTKKTHYKADDIKNGISKVKGIGSEFKSIAEALKTFKEFCTTKKGENGVSFEQMKKSIKETIAFSMELFAAIGGDATADKNIFGDGSVISKIKTETLKSAKEKLKQVSDGFKNIQEINKSFTEKSDSKSVSFQEIKNKILNIIEFSIQLFAAICGDQDSLKLLFPNLGENISIRDARQQLKKIKNSVDGLKEVLDEFKKINVKDLDKSARVKIIDAINDILFCVSSTSEKLNNTVGFHSIEKKMPKVLNSVRTLNDCIDSIKTTNGKEKIKSLSDGIKEYMDVVSKSKITPDKLNHLNKISQVIIKFAKVQDPFTKFQKAFKEHVKDFEKYIELLNKINIQKLNPYITFTDKSYELIRTGPVDLKGKSEFIIGILTKTVDKLNEAVTLMNDNVTNQQTENSNNNDKDKNSSHNNKDKNSYKNILNEGGRNYDSITRGQTITAGVLEDILTSITLKVK